MTSRMNEPFKYARAILRWLFIKFSSSLYIAVKNVKHISTNIKQSKKKSKGLSL
jgi:hypothetical protein